MDSRSIMADSTFVAGDSSGPNDNNKGSEVELNIKTLDSRIHTFRVNTNMLVSALKGIIASAIGVPVGQQRLIFRGRVLKDDHHLSDYQVENGHTLHLVKRQHVQPQTQVDQALEMLMRTATIMIMTLLLLGPEAEWGQVSNSVVLGTFNIGGDQGESIAPDLGRIIGAMLNSVGLGNLASSAGTSSSSSSVNLSSSNVQENQGTEAHGTQGNGGNGSQTGNIGQMGQGVFNLPFQSLQSSAQMPLAGAAVNGSSLPMAIPDSSTPLLEFINRLELALSENGTQASSSPSDDIQRPNGSSINVNSLPTVEGLTTVMRRAQQLLSNHVERTISCELKLKHRAMFNQWCLKYKVRQCGWVLQCNIWVPFFGAWTQSLFSTQGPQSIYLNSGQILLWCSLFLCKRPPFFLVQALQHHLQILDFWVLVV